MPEVFVVEGARRHDRHLGHHHPPDELRSGEEVSGHREHLRRAAGLVRAEDVQHAGRHAGARRARLHRRADRRHGHGEPIEGVPRRRVARTSATPASRIASSGTRPSPRSTRTTTSRASASTARRPADRTRRAAAVPSGVLQGRGRRTPAATTTAWTRSGGTSSGWAGRSARTTRRRRTWTTRTKLKGQLHARRAASWTRTSIRRRRCRSSNALIEPSKDFELVVIPGANHGAGSPITHAQAQRLLREAPARPRSAELERAARQRRRPTAATTTRSITSSSSARRSSRTSISPEGGDDGRSRASSVGPVAWSESRLRRRGRRHVGRRDRHQHDDFHDRQRRAAASVTVRGTGAPGHALGEQPR